MKDIIQGIDFFGCVLALLVLIFFAFIAVTTIALAHRMLTGALFCQ